MLKKKEKGKEKNIKKNKINMENNRKNGKIIKIITINNMIGIKKNKEIKTFIDGLMVCQLILQKGSTMN